MKYIIDIPNEMVIKSVLNGLTLGIAMTETSTQKQFIIPTNIPLIPYIEPQKWIPCSERLPEYEEYVLATFADKSTIDTKVLSVRRIETFDGWCWSDFADEYTWEKDEIIAWMPLPEPWKGEEE